MHSAFVMVALRLGVLVVFLAGVMFVLEKRWRVLTNFANEPSTAFNLALIRIVVMAVMLAKVSLPYIRWFAALDPTFIHPIHVWDSWLLYRSETSLILTVAYVVFVTATIFGMIGFFGRISCLISAIFFVFLMGVPQLYGRVEHTEHHLALFALILSTARCCDTLSIDAVLAAIRRGDQRRLTKPVPSIGYALPIKAMMVMIALFYIFPGLWKFAHAGMLWFSAKNMQLLLAAKIYEVGLTPLRLWAVDHLELQTSASIGTIVFEIGFIFAILWPRARPIAALVGIGFHSAIYFVMGINFGALAACYVILIDWTQVFDAIARFLKLGPVIVLFDGHCKLCRRTVSTLYNFDWLDRLSVFPNHDEAQWPAEARSVLDAATIADRFVAIDASGRVAFAYHAYELIAARMPILWPLRVVMYIPGVNIIGSAIYERIAHSRTCSIRDAHAPISYISAEPRHQYSLMNAVAALLLVAVALAGSTRSVNAWPISCFPTFDWPGNDKQVVLSIDALDADGGRHQWTMNFDPILSQFMRPERYQGMVEQFTNGEVAFAKKHAVAMLELWQRYHPFAHPITSAAFYADEYHVLPKEHEAMPLKHIKLGEIATADGL